MKKALILFFIFLVGIFVVLEFSSADCGGCIYNNVCYSIGEVANNHYCSISKTLVDQKQDNSSCMNDFECSSEYCFDDLCINEDVIKDNENISRILGEYSSYLSQGNCTASPGCLNLASLANARNVSGICVGLQGYRCFQCNSDQPYWNGTGCAITPCSSDIGCWNITRLNLLNNFENKSGYCGAGFRCVNCNSEYSWNGTECKLIPISVAGSSFWTSTFFANSQQLSEGYNTLLAAKQRVRVIISGKNHYAGIISLSSTSAVINVSSTSQQAVFNIQDEKRFELTDDAYYDLYIKLNGISNNKANLTIKSIHEAVSGSAPSPSPSPAPSPSLSPSPSPAPSQQTTTISKTVIIVIIVGLIAAIVIIIFIAIFLFKSRKKQKSEDNNNHAKILFMPSPQKRLLL